jgi:hypothetical protein
MQKITLKKNQHLAQNYMGISKEVNIQDVHEGDQIIVPREFGLRSEAVEVVEKVRRRDGKTEVWFADRVMGRMFTTCASHRGRLLVPAKAKVSRTGIVEFDGHFIGTVDRKKTQSGVMKWYADDPNGNRVGIRFDTRASAVAMLVRRAQGVRR